MGPCSKHSSQWPVDEEMDMEHISPDDFPIYEEDEYDIQPVDYEYEEEEEYLKQEDTPEELDFNDDRHAGWR